MSAVNPEHLAGAWKRSTMCEASRTASGTDGAATGLPVIVVALPTTLDLTRHPYRWAPAVHLPPLALWPACNGPECDPDCPGPTTPAPTWRERASGVRGWASTVVAGLALGGLTSVGRVDARPSLPSAEYFGDASPTPRGDG